MIVVLVVLASLYLLVLKRKELNEKVKHDLVHVRVERVERELVEVTKTYGSTS